MKAGLPGIDALMVEIDRQASLKRDVLARTKELRAYTMPSWDRAGASNVTSLDLKSEGAYSLNDWAHKQIRAHLDIPADYYGRLRQRHPRVLDDTLNGLFSYRPDDEIRLIRCLDTQVRGFVSNGYHSLDYVDMMRYLFPIFARYPDMQLESCQITPTKLYLKVTLPSRTRDLLSVGDRVSFGAIFYNSEVGDGRIGVKPFSKVLSCLNGAMHDQYGLSRAHIGRKLHLDLEEEEDEGIQQFISDEARQAADHAFFLKMRDVTEAILSDVVADALAAQMEEATTVRVKEPEAAVTVIASKGGFTEAERSAVMNHLVMAGSNSLWAIANAITRASTDVDDYDRASKLEELGGRVMALQGKARQTIVEATMNSEIVKAVTRKTGARSEAANTLDAAFQTS